MNNDLNLKKLWQQPSPIQPTLATFLSRARQFKRQQTTQLVTSSILLLATAIFIPWLTWFYHPQFWTTRIGAICIVLAIAIFITAQSKLLPLLLQDNNHFDNKTYLIWLQKIAHQKNRLQHQVISWYFVLLSIGIALYLYEYTSKMPPVWAWISYGLTTLWITFNWWYLRPRIIQKQQMALQILQTQLQTLQTQWDDPT